MAARGAAGAQDEPGIQLDLFGRFVPLLPTLDAEVVVGPRAIHAFDEAVGAR